MLAESSLTISDNIHYSVADMIKKLSFSGIILLVIIMGFTYVLASFREKSINRVFNSKGQSIDVAFSSIGKPFAIDLIEKHKYLLDRNADIAQCNKPVYVIYFNGNPSLWYDHFEDTIGIYVDSDEKICGFERSGF